MTTTDKTARGQGEAIEFEFELRHPPHKVWRALTDPVLLQQWLLPTIGFSLKTGADFTLQAPPQPGWDGVVHCRVLEVQTLERLRYAWVVGELDTIVTFTLVPTETGTRLTLVQTGFRPEQKQNFGGARYGWRMMGERLEAALEAAA
ncbi:MAG: SRPBCC domain-containing protein [Nannocystaceae bacterium]|nr:SRPBCC domain-containing protein [Nannocystaceae bacterium]